MDVAAQLHKMFGASFNQVINSCLLIISKVGATESTFQELIGCIEQISQQNSSVSPEGVMLMKTLIAQKRIAEFPTPRNINDDTINQIKESIKKIPLFHVAQEPNLALSHDGKNAIDNLIDRIDKQKNKVL